MASADILTIVVGLATFALIMGGAAVIRSYRDAAHRLERETLASVTRRAADGGRFVGGSNRPGEN